MDFLASMILNFTDNDGQVAKQQYEAQFAATKELMEIVESSSLVGIERWIEDLGRDSEAYGSAFFTIYCFAEDYRSFLENNCLDRI